MYQQCKERQYRIGIWGAGKRGRDFLKVCDPKGQYIECVFDNNDALNGALTETGHRICKYSEKHDKIDVVFVMNRYHYQVIRRNEIAKNPNVKFVNLDLCLQHNLELKW